MKPRSPQLWRRHPVSGPENLQRLLHAHSATIGASTTQGYWGRMFQAVRRIRTFQEQRYLHAHQHRIFRDSAVGIDLSAQHARCTAVKPGHLCGVAGGKTEVQCTDPLSGVRIGFDSYCRTYRRSSTYLPKVVLEVECQKQNPLKHALPASTLLSAFFPAS